VRSKMLMTFALVLLLLASGLRAADVSDADRMVSEALVKGAKEKFRAGKHEDAANLLAQALDKWPGNAEGVHLFAQTREKQGKEQEAAKLYRRYLELTPDAGDTSERVLARLRVRKFDEKYDKLAARKARLLRDVKELLTDYADDLTAVEKRELEVLVAVLEGKKVKGPEEQHAEGSDDWPADTGDDKGDKVHTTAAPGRTIELLALVDPDKHAVNGVWTKTKGSISAIGGTSRLLIPVRPNGNYELKATIVWHEEQHGATFILPVAPRKQVQFVACGWRGATSGIANIDGRNANKNVSACRCPPLEYGRPYVLDIRVVLKGEQVSIESELDGKKHVNWTGPLSSLSFPEAWSIGDQRALGLGDHGGVEYRSVKLRMLSGEAEVLE